MSLELTRARTIPELFRARVAETPDRRAFTSYVGGRWEGSTWRDYENSARAFALGLAELGLVRGDVVAILGSTRSEWCVADIGALCAGGVTVGLYPSLQAEGLGSMHYILEHSEACFVVVDNVASLSSKILPVLSRLPHVQKIIVWDYDANAAPADPRIVAWSEVLASGRAAHERAPHRFEQLARGASPADRAVLVYTSGTTGQPKGAIITHGNVISLQSSLAGLLPADDGAPDGGSTVVFLPMAHVGARCIAHYGRIREGYAAQFARSMETLFDDLAIAKPTRFSSVPRIFEKEYTKVRGDLSKATGLKGRIGRAVFAAGLDVWRSKQSGRTVGIKTRVLARFFEERFAIPLRMRFGGRCAWFISGAAPISVEILELFDACGFRTFELYGLTESCGVLTLNRPGGLRYGTVGRAIPGVELRIAEDGEICARGPNIFAGYLKDPTATSEALVDGWLHTGDIGAIDADGFLRITDRKKNILVTAGGKNITPSNIENEVKNHPLVSYCHLHADKRAYPSALICLDPERLRVFAEDRGLRGRTAAELKDDPTLRAAVQEAIDEANAAFSQFERIKKFAILPAEFSLNSGELTPTLKVKRKEVERNHRAILDALYAE